MSYKDKEKRRKSSLAYYHRHKNDPGFKEKMHTVGARTHLKRKYGLTPEQLHEMRVHQDNKCAICGDTTALVVDHNHETNVVRALLCSACNKSVLPVVENVELLQAAIAYLRKTDPQHPLFNVSEVTNG